jgi:septation ring formation regulator EzrA
MQKTDLRKMTLNERVEALNNMILQGNSLEAFEYFYAEEIEMQENEDSPTGGKAENRLREEETAGKIAEFRHAEVKNVLISDNISVVEWDLDFTHEDWGDRKYTQVSVQRWNEDGQIVNEKFYYNS